MLIKIAEYFGVTTDYLLDRDIRSRIDVEGLTQSEIQHHVLIANDIKSKHT